MNFVLVNLGRITENIRSELVSNFNLLIFSINLISRESYQTFELYISKSVVELQHWSSNLCTRFALPPLTEEDLASPLTC